MMIKYTLTITSALVFAALTACSSVLPDAKAELDLQVYNPKTQSIFPVTSTLVTGPSEAILFDAQFQKNDAQKLVEMIKASGKTLTTIYISHGDPDFYFGLDVLNAAFPDARIVATPATVAKIKHSMQSKKAYWGPILKENAPEKLVLPETLASDRLMIDGNEIKIIGFGGHDPLHTFAWIPSEKTVLGGVVLFENMHLWMADNQTTASRDAWIKTLDNMIDLKPNRVIAGHVLGDANETMDVVYNTKSYVSDFDDSDKKSNNAIQLINVMLEKYPNYEDAKTLEFSAKVIKGDIQWPQ